MHIAWATTLPYLLLCMVCAVSLSFLYISVKRHRMRLNNRSIGTLAPDGGRLDCSGGARAEHRTVCARADRKDALTRGHNALYASATCAHSHARSACALPTHVAVSPCWAPTPQYISPGSESADGSRTSSTSSRGSLSKRPFRLSSTTSSSRPVKHKNKTQEQNELLKTNWECVARLPTAHCLAHAFDWRGTTTTKQRLDWRGPGAWPCTRTQQRPSVHVLILELLTELGGHLEALEGYEIAVRLKHVGQARARHLQHVRRQLMCCAVAAIAVNLLPPV
eukprot:scaffold19940_cov124-Isochrysis_galbana.AAC.5